MGDGVRVLPVLCAGASVRGLVSARSPALREFLLRRGRSRLRIHLKDQDLAVAVRRRRCLELGLGVASKAEICLLDRGLRGRSGEEGEESRGHLLVGEERAQACHHLRDPHGEAVRGNRERHVEGVQSAETLLAYVRPPEAHRAEEGLQVRPLRFPSRRATPGEPRPHDPLRGLLAAREVVREGEPPQSEEKGTIPRSTRSWLLRSSGSFKNAKMPLSGSWIRARISAARGGLSCTGWYRIATRDRAIVRSSFR